MTAVVLLLSLVTNPNPLTPFVIHEGWNCSYFTATFSFHKIAWISQTTVLVFIIYHLQNPTKVFGRILPSFLSKNNADNTLFQLCQSAKHHCRILVNSWSCWPAPRPDVWTTNESAWAIFLAYVSAPPTRLIYPPPPAQIKFSHKVMKYWHIAHFRHLTHTKSHSYQFLHPAPVASTDAPYTPSLYSCLEANAEQPEADDVFFDMLVKFQVRKKCGMSLWTNCVLTEWFR